MSNLSSSERMTAPSGATRCSQERRVRSLRSARLSTRCLAVLSRRRERPRSRRDRNRKDARSMVGTVARMVRRAANAQSSRKAGIARRSSFECTTAARPLDNTPSRACRRYARITRCTTSGSRCPVDAGVAHRGHETGSACSARQTPAYRARDDPREHDPTPHTRRPPGDIQ